MLSCSRILTRHRIIANHAHLNIRAATGSSTKISFYASNPPRQYSSNAEYKHEHGQEAAPVRRAGRASLIAIIFGLTAAGYGFLTYFRGEHNAHGTLNKTSFIPFVLTKKERVSSTSSLFTLEQTHSQTGLAQTVQEKETAGVWSIEIKQPQLQIARSYTPLPSLQEEKPDKHHLRLLIRREHKGEVSNFLHRLPENANIEVRGPTVEYALPDGVSDVVFMAGGTGIAPAIQIAHSLQMQNQGANMTILWANRKREDCEGGRSDSAPVATGWLSALGKFMGQSSQSSPPRTSTSGAIVRQLEHLKQGTNSTLRIDYYVDEEGTFIRPNNISPLVSKTNAGSDRSPGRKIIFVSGPEGFVKYWSGPKEWVNGREAQGRLGGALSRMNLEDWEVVKL